MTGSLTEKSGKYYVITRVETAEGKKKKFISTGISTKGNNKRKAQEKMREILAKLEKEQVVYTAEIPFLEWLDEWLEQKRADLRINTYEGYLSYMKNHIRPFYKPLKLSLQKVTPMHIQRFYNLKIKEGLTANSVHKFSAILRGALRDAMEKNLIPYNPADRAKLPKKKKFVGKFYTVEEANALLKAVENDPIKPAVILGLFYGLRRSEICGLRWKDIDFEKGTLSICNTVVMTTTIIEHEQTKSRASKRTMYIIPETKQYFSELKQERIHSMKNCGIDFNSSIHVCSWEDGSMFLPNYVSNHFKAILKKQGLPIIRFHELRHTAGSLLLEKGLSAKQIQEYLGHENISTTLDIYGHLSLEGKMEAANTMGSVFHVEVS